MPFRVSQTIAAGVLVALAACSDDNQSTNSDASTAPGEAGADKAVGQDASMPSALVPWLSGGGCCGLLLAAAAAMAGGRLKGCTTHVKTTSAYN